MTNTQRGILIMIKAALTGKAPEPYQVPDAPSTAEPVSNAPQSLPNTLPPDFDLGAAYKEIRRHQITPLAYAGAVLCGVPKDHPVMQQMFRIYLQQMLHSENQTAAVNKIFATFDQHDIDYVPLKGTTLKKLYPKPEYRLMGDADILIRPEHYAKAEPLLKELGFTFKGANPHEYTWLSQNLYLELHTCLFAYVLKDYYDYYEDSWHLFRPSVEVNLQEPQGPNKSPAAAESEAKVATQFSGASSSAQLQPQGTETKKASHRYSFRTPEDEFIYLFTHYAKHVRTGGIGCRHIIDLWVYRNAFPQMDDGYIIGVMSKLNLQDFYTTTLNLLEVWFGTNGSATMAPERSKSDAIINADPAGETDTATEFLSEFIFASGNWGDAKTHALAGALMDMQNRGSGQYSKKQSLLRKAFPDIDHMSTRYPVLKKHPVLLPAFWPVRIVSAVLFRRDNVSHIWQANKYATEEKIDDFQTVLETIGLKFDFTKED